MIKSFAPLLALALAPLILASSAEGAALASDNASAYAYDDGWTTGDNGGSGFGAWTVSATSGSGGRFIGSSTANADGLDNGTQGGVASDGDINTTTGPNPDQSGSPDPNSTAGRAWGLFANSGAISNAVRPFTGTLSIGQTVNFSFDNGYFAGTVGVGLQNAAGDNLWEFYYTTGNASYTNSDGNGAVLSGLGFGDEGIDFSFTLTGAASYSLSVTRKDGVAYTNNTGALIANADQAIAQVRIFNSNAGAGSANDVYANSMSVVPEPSSLLLASFGLGLAALGRRRR